MDAKIDDYKRMKLRHNGIILDDNKYLLTCIESPNESVQCEIDTKIIGRLYLKVLFNI